jgi:hypothetical protein
MSRKKGTPEGFRGVAEGYAKFTPSLGEDHSLFATKELTVGFMKAGGGGGVMCEGGTKLFVEDFAFIVESTIHGVGAMDGLMGVLTSRVGIGIKSCCLENLGECLIFGCGHVQ